MKRIVLGLFLVILMIGIIGTAIADNDTNAPDTGCKNLYWIDNDNKDCSQKQFCGMYMYLGLQTFESKTQCEKAVNKREGCTLEECGVDGTSCDKDEDCACGVSILTGDCFIGNKYYVNTSIQCPDFCTGIGGNFRIQCINNKCDQVNINKVCPVESNSEDNKCYKTLSNGRKAEIKIMPDTASETAIERLGELNFTIELKEVGANITKPSSPKLVYELTADKEGKMVGLFKIKGKIITQVDAETGDIISVKKPWWSFLAGI
ncbi:MAG: PepSY domain-containing protein [Candidatus Nanoarchaeia archaeon]|nr:PepSY domain-containing protein [Candidatus Nanoarchaeia archaeon]